MSFSASDDGDCDADPVSSSASSRSSRCRVGEEFIPNLFQWLKQLPALDPSAAPPSVAFPYQKKEKAVLLKKMRCFMPLLRVERQSPFDLFSRAPLSTLFLANIGLIVGNSYLTVMDYFQSRYGTVKELMMTGLCPFALLDVGSASVAEQIRRDLDGCTIAELGNRTIYIEFIRKEACSLWNQPDSEHRMKIPNSASVLHQFPLNAMSKTEFDQFMAMDQQSREAAVEQYRNRIKAENANHPSFPPLTYIPGFLLVEDFLSAFEESELLQFLASEPWLEYRFRSVQHYGYEFDYEINNIHLGKAKWWREFESKESQQCERSYLHRYPALLHDILERFRLVGQVPCIKAFEDPCTCTAASNASFEPDQLTVNRYEPGQGISPHVDIHSPFCDLVVIISLGAPIVMEIIHEPKPAEGKSSEESEPVRGVKGDPTAVPNTTLNRLAKNRVTFNVVLPPRSLLVLSHDVRYGYTHAIAARKTDRIENVIVPRTLRTSLTFRQTREAEIESNPNCSKESVRVEEEKSLPATPAVFSRSNNGPTFSRSGPGLPVCRCAYPYLCDTQSGIAKKAKSHLKELNEPSKRSRNSSNTSTGTSSTQTEK